MNNFSIQEDYAIPYEHVTPPITEKEIYIQIAFATVTVGLVWVVASFIFSL